MKATVTQLSGGEAGVGKCAVGGAVTTTLPRCFDDLVRQLGGDPRALLRQAGVGDDGAGHDIAYAALRRLLATAAETLACPDFGMRLAALQGVDKSVGPLSLVMNNARTLGEALAYCAEHSNASSLAMHASVESDPAGLLLTIRSGDAGGAAGDGRQVVEYGLLLVALSIHAATGGAARVRRVALSHRPAAAPALYRERFGCEVAFGQRANSFLFAETDMACSIANPDAQVYEMVTFFIESRYPRAGAGLSRRVKQLILQNLGNDESTCENVATRLRLHPRTLQRRLREEGFSFAELKDEVRRDAALRFLQDTRMPLKVVAEALGYAEPSVLSRSCYRWFSAGPRQLRAKLRTAVRPARPAQRTPARLSGSLSA